MKRTVWTALCLAAAAVAMAMREQGGGPCPHCSLAPVETCEVAVPSAPANVPTLAPPRERPAPEPISRFQPQGQVVYLTVEAEAGLAGER